MPRRLGVKSHFIQASIPLVVFIGVILGVVFYHALRGGARQERAENGQTALYKNVYAQDYEPMHAVMSSRLPLEQGAPRSVAVSSFQTPGARRTPDAVISLNRLKDYIGSLQKQITLLEDKLARLNESAVLKATESDYLKRANASLKSALAQLQTEREKKNAALVASDVRVQEKLKYVNEKMQLVNQLLVARQEEIGRLKTENSDLVANLNRLFETHLELRQELDANTHTVKEGVGTARFDLPNLNMMKFVNVGLQEQIDQLTDKVVELKNIRVELENQLRIVRQEKEDLQNQIELAKGDFSRQEEENQKLRQTIEGLKAALDKKAQDIDTLQVPYQDLQMEVSRLRVIKDEYEKRIAALTERMGALGVSEDDSQQTILRLNALVTKNEIEKEFALQEKAEQAVAAQQELEEAQQQNQELMGVIGKKDDTLREYKSKTLDTLKEKVRLLNQQFSDSRKEQLRLKKDLARVQSLNAYLHRRMKKMHMELELRRSRDRK